jgi:hypothetical protein
MTYRVEITAQTIQELAGKLITLGNQFQTTPGVSLNANQSHTSDELAASAAEEPGVDAKVAPTPQKPKPETTKAEPKKAEEPKVEEPKVAALEYQKDVVPKVLALVEKRGKDAAQALLATFGAVKASGVKPAQYAELLAAIADAMDA